MKTLAFVALLPVLALTACAEPAGETPVAGSTTTGDAMVADTVPVGPALSDVTPEQVGEAPVAQDMPVENDREFAPDS